MKSTENQLSVLQNKAKERTVRTQSIEYDLETLVKKIKKGLIKLDPDYQRRHRWDDETSSKLVESLILNIPVPLIYLSQDIDVDTETEESRYSVIDGQQRLTAILNFFDGKFSLTGLDVLEDLNGCKYGSLPPFLIRRLEERSIRCLRIDSTLDGQVKYDIFERLNSGAVKLEAHELRNAVYRGPFNNLCKELSKDKNFRILLQIPLDSPYDNTKVKKMEDVELVLRFFGLRQEKYRNYRKSKSTSFKNFLSQELRKKNAEDGSRYDEYAKRFTSTMKFIIESFGEIAFAKYKFEDKKFALQSKFNASVYDALAIAIDSEITSYDQKLSNHKVKSFKDLFKKKDFHNSVSGSTLDSSKIIYRIDAVRKLLRE